MARSTSCMLLYAYLDSHRKELHSIRVPACSSSEDEQYKEAKSLSYQ
jgi:hypothetical protein